MFIRFHFNGYDLSCFSSDTSFETDQDFSGVTFSNEVFDLFECILVRNNEEYTNCNLKLVYEVCQLSRKCGIFNTILGEKLIKWITPFMGYFSSWEHKEYTYLMWTEFNFNVWLKFFVVDDDFELTKQTITFMESRSFKEGSECRKFFSSFKIEGLFDSFDSVTHTFIQARAKLIKQNSDILLVDPFAAPASFLVEKKFDGEYWKPHCRQSPPVVVNIPLLPTYEEACDRFERFTEGVIAKSVNPKLKDETFPWDNVCIAGGCVRQLLEQTYAPRESSDVDIFLYGSDFEENKKRLEKLKEWFHCPGTIYGIRGSVVYIFVPGIKRNIQIICSSFVSPGNILNRFDVSGIQHCMYFTNGKFEFRSTASALDTLCSRVCNVHNLSKCRLERMVKLLLAGYGIEKSPIISSLFSDLDDLQLNNPEVLKELVDKVHSHFWVDPTHYRGVPENIRNQIIEGTVKTITGAQFVTTKLSEVDRFVVINGSFDIDYESMSFSTYRIDKLLKVPRRDRYSGYVRDSLGIVQLVSDKMVIKSITEQDGAYEFSVNVTDEFAKFLEETVCDRTFKIYANQCAKNIVLKDNVVNFTLERDVIKRFEDKKMSVARAPNGEPLDLVDHVLEKHEIQIMFQLYVEICSWRNDYEINIKPQRIINHTVVKETDEQIIDTNVAQMKTDGTSAEVLTENFSEFNI